MALKKYKDFSKMTDSALETEISAAKQRMTELKFEHKVKGLSNPSAITHLRREIAQMSTTQTERSKNKNA